MKRLVKYSFIAFGILVLLAPVLYVVVVNAALKAHAKEDSIVFDGKRVEEAINEYVKRHGSPPPKLENLVPEFIESLPTFPDISRIDYHLSAGGKDWTLDLYWTSRKVPLIFRRTNAGLNSEDNKRRIDTESGCYVLKSG